MNFGSDINDMDIIQLPLTSLLNNIMQTPQSGQILNLKEGSIVPATIVEIRGGSFATIQIAEVKLNAKLYADLQVGDKVNLLVTGNIDQEAIELKLISKISFNNVNQQQLDIEGLANIFDISDKDEAKPLLKELINSGISINPEIIQSAIKALKQLPLGSVSSVTLANIIELGIPIMPETLIAVQTLESNFNFHELLSKLNTSTQAIVDEGLERPLPQTTFQNLQQFHNILKQLLNESSNVTELNTKVNLLGLDHEIKIADLISKGLDTNINLTLKHLLLSLQGQAADLQKAGLSSLVENLDILLNHLTGQQLITQAVQDKSGQVYSFFSIPMKTNEANQTIEFQVMSKNKAGSKSLDPLNCYILIHLQMPNLGGLDIHMNIVDNNVNLRFVSDKPTKIAQVDRDEINMALNDVGFNLDMFKFEEKEHPNSRLEVLPPIISHKKIDTKV